MIFPLERPDRRIRPDLLIAIASLLLLLIAKPLFAQTSSSTGTTGTTNNSLTTGTTSPGGSLSPTLNPAMTATPGPSNQPSTSSSQTTYLNPPTGTPTVTPGSSQSQRDASARQIAPTNPQMQQLPECRIEDTACIEQRNRLNQTNPQTAPTFTR